MLKCYMELCDAAKIFNTAESSVFQIANEQFVIVNYENNQ